MLFLIENTQTGQLARHDCTGEHDGKFTDDAGQAITFDSRGAAYEFAQNFGPDWGVAEY